MTVARAPSAREILSGTQAGMDDGGALHVLWREALLDPVAVPVVKAASAPAGGAFGAPQELFAGVGDRMPRLRVTPGGGVVAMISGAGAQAADALSRFRVAGAWQPQVVAPRAAVNGAPSAILLGDGRAAWAETAPHSSGSGTAVRIVRLDAAGAVVADVETPQPVALVERPAFTSGPNGSGLLAYYGLDASSGQVALHARLANVGSVPGMFGSFAVGTVVKPVQPTCQRAPIIAPAHDGASGFAGLAWTNGVGSDCGISGFQVVFGSGTQTSSAPLAPSQGWALPTAVAGYEPRIVSARDGSALAAWVETIAAGSLADARVMWSAKIGAAPWTTPQVLVADAADAGAVVAPPAIAIDAAGRVAIALATARAATAGSTAMVHRVSVARFSFNGGFGAWTTVADRVGPAFAAPAVAIAPNMDPVVVYGGTVCAGFVTDARGATSGQGCSNPGLYAARF